MTGVEKNNGEKKEELYCFMSLPDNCRHVLRWHDKEEHCSPSGHPSDSRSYRQTGLPLRFQGG